MNISKMASTVILATIFAVVFLFALIFYLYSSISGISLNNLKDALSMTASFFGGIATLVAAYVAAKLFNDWKEQERMVFIRNTFHETSNLLNQLMLSMQQFPKINLPEIRVLQSRVTTNLGFLHRQIKDGDMKSVRDNFGIFIDDFYDILIDNADGVLTPDQTKKEINENLKSFKSEYAYVAELIDIDNVYQKVKAIK